LFLAERKLSLEEYSKWNKAYQKAKESMDDENVATVNA